MNMHAKPELFAPCFPDLEVNKPSIEIDADNVQFSFKIASYSIDCEIKAVELSDSLYFEPQLDPENGFDSGFQKLEVDNRTLVLITRSDIDEAPAGSVFKLTADQVYAMNDWLECTAVEEHEKKLVSVEY
ncbi:MAG: hypothetical protein RR605_00770 [Acinetobacter sp.]